MDGRLRATRHAFFVNIVLTSLCETGSSVYIIVVRSVGGFLHSVFLCVGRTTRLIVLELMSEIMNIIFSIRIHNSYLKFEFQ
ncbi:hypothetical protein V1521DRAFT_166562 [Lipomyces starkeyi]